MNQGTVKAPEGRVGMPDWPAIDLGDICTLANGNAYRETDWSDSGVPIIRIQNLNDEAKPFNYWNGPLGNRVLVKDGDVLLAWSGTPGTSFGAHLWRRGQGLLNQHIFRVDLDTSRVDPQWAVYTINDQLDHLIRKAHGAVGLSHVTRREVESLRIPLPALAEQKRIVAILNRQMAAVDKARIAAEYQASLAFGICRRHLLSTFGEIAQSAPKTHPLEEVAQLLPSKSISTIGEATVEAVTTACLTEGGFDRRGVKTAQMAAKDVPDCVLSPGEILVARSNTPELMGRAAMFPGDDHPIVASDLTIRVQAGDRLLPEFLAAYLSYLYVSGYWLERSGGASGTMKKITRTQIAALPVPVPAIEAQRPVAAKMKDVFGAVSEVLRAIDENISAISALPSSLLRRAFSGGL